MPPTVRGKRDRVLAAIADALQEYERGHPRARIELYRRNRAAVRVRVIDPDFTGLDRQRRDDLIWPYLEKARSGAAGDITMLVLLTPEEAPHSIANLDFEHPSPSVGP
jgi:hypothetical protein